MNLNFSNTCGSFCIHCENSVQKNTQTFLQENAKLMGANDPLFLASPNLH